MGRWLPRVCGLCAIGLVGHAHAGALEGVRLAQMTVERPETALPAAPPPGGVSVRQRPPQVDVRQDEPRVRVRQPPPEVEIEQDPPSVSVERPEPQVTVTAPPAEVEVRQAPPRVAVTQRPPRVDVVQPQPEVRLESDAAQVEVRSEAPTVVIERGEPEVVIERAAPQLLPFSAVTGRTLLSREGERLGVVETVLMEARSDRLYAIVANAAGVKRAVPYPVIMEEGRFITAPATVSRRYRAENFVPVPADRVVGEPSS